MIILGHIFSNSVTPIFILYLHQYINILFYNNRTTRRKYIISIIFLIYIGYGNKLKHHWMFLDHFYVAHRSWFTNTAISLSAIFVFFVSFCRACDLNMNYSFYIRKYALESASSISLLLLYMLNSHMWPRL